MATTTTYAYPEKESVGKAALGTSISAALIVSHFSYVGLNAGEHGGFPSRSISQSFWSQASTSFRTELRSAEFCKIRTQDRAADERVNLPLDRGLG